MWMWQTHIINYLQFVEVGRISTMRTWRFESLGNKFIIVVIAEALPVPGYLVQLVAWPVSWLDRFGHMNWKEDLETFTETWIEGWLGSRLQSHQHGWDDIWWHVWNFPGKNSRAAIHISHLDPIIAPEGNSASKLRFAWKNGRWYTLHTFIFEVQWIPRKSLNFPIYFP